MRIIRKAFLFCFVLIFIINILVPKGGLVHYHTRGRRNVPGSNEGHYKTL